MKTIEVPITKGYITLVDEDDAQKVTGQKWWTIIVTKNRNIPQIYVQGLSRETGKRIYLHRFIMNPPNHLRVDHKNHNGLDNRKSNLRIATNSQNAANRRIEVGQMGFRGVRQSPNSKRNPFYANVAIEGKTLHLGCFPTAIEAALAYDKRAYELFGSYAILNFPNLIQENNYVATK
jgi:hypothetical protein